VRAAKPKGLTPTLIHPGVPTLFVSFCGRSARYAGALRAGKKSRRKTSASSQVLELVETRVFPLRSQERSGLVLGAGSFVALRSGNWNNDTKSGVFTLNFNWTPTNFNTNVGLRVARERMELRALLKKYFVAGALLCAVLGG
jgi:hypothetical protein